MQPLQLLCFCARAWQPAGSNSSCSCWAAAAALSRQPACGCRPAAAAPAAPQVRKLGAAAQEVRVQQQQQQWPGTRAAALMSTMPPELSSALPALAAASDAQGAGLFSRVQEWGWLGLFHQEPLHDVNLSLMQSYGAIRHRGY